MANETNSLLFDVIEGCRRIEEFTASLGFEEYDNNDLIRSAVERQFIIIGEAINRLKAFEGVYSAIPYASQIVGFRNILVHGYNVVSNELVWEIVRDHLSELKETCESFLEE
ncbi:MAG TPA: DUF86 domain-containing protein [Pyrinomonadaceae bacterium]|nr:DUF86 domain-containing protein [Pyrinomonadaceae bacterium]